MPFRLSLCASLTAALLVACRGGESVTPASEASQIGPLGTRCLTSRCIYVASHSEGFANQKNIVQIFAGDTKGDKSPLAKIYGGKTALYGPNGIAVDSSHKLYVVNVRISSHPSSINVYGPGQYGNVAPAGIISGSQTSLYLPNGIALDSSGNIYVADGRYGSGCPGGDIAVFAAGATGNVAPTQLITGYYTSLCNPNGIALDSERNIYVTDYDTDAVTVYAAGSSGNVAPMATISGPDTGIAVPTGIAVDAQGYIYVAIGVNASGYGAVLVFAPGSSGDVAPTRMIGGYYSALIGPQLIGLDASGNVWSPNAGNNSITAYKAGASGDVRPFRRIIGTKTKLEIPYALFVK